LAELIESLLTDISLAQVGENSAVFMRS